MSEVKDGRSILEEQGFSYHPQFITLSESEKLISYFASLQPLWEERHREQQHQRGQGATGRRLTRPVYWLGAWQFACLGYYAEPHYVEHRCVRAEPFPQVLQAILDRIRPVIQSFHSSEVPNTQKQSANLNLPNTCLINYYGRKVGQGVPVDFARLRMHQDSEPGPVVMLSIGQPGLFELLDPNISTAPEKSLWIRHRSLTVFSGANYKDRLYHRITKVRTGNTPVMPSPLSGFELRRVSISFRSIPKNKIEDFSALPADSKELIRDYMQMLSEKSPHFKNQLDKEQLDKEQLDKEQD